MEYKNRKTQSSPGQSSKTIQQSSPFESKKSNPNFLKPALISIFRTEELEKNIDSAFKLNQNCFPQIFPNLKYNEPTPTFPKPNEITWEDQEEGKIEQVKNGKINDFEFDNISVIEKENISGIGGLSGDIPALFDLKNSGEQIDNSSEVFESKVEVLVCLNDLDKSSLVNPGSSRDLSILPENNVTIVMSENPVQSVISSSKDKKRKKIKSVKIPKILPVRSPHPKSRTSKLKNSSIDSPPKLKQVSESKSSINIKSQNSLIKRNSLLGLSQSSKKFLPKMKSKQFFSTSKPFSLALSLVNTPYLQEFKKPVLSSLIPPKKPLEDPIQKRTKKRIQIF
jgi:hypothetical protein